MDSEGVKKAHRSEVTINSVQNGEFPAQIQKTLSNEVKINLSDKGDKASSKVFSGPSFLTDSYAAELENMNLTDSECEGLSRMNLTDEYKLGLRMDNVFVPIVRGGNNKGRSVAQQHRETGRRGLNEEKLLQALTELEKQQVRLGTLSSFSK